MKRVVVFVQRLFGVTHHIDGLCLKMRALGLSSQKPGKQALERDEAAISTFAAKTLPALKKVPHLSSTLIFLDETGSSLKTTVGRTWSPRSQTPVTKMYLKWYSLSIIDALTSDGRVFQHTHRHAIRPTQIVAFFEHLLFFIAGPVKVVLDRVAIHRAKHVQDWLIAQPHMQMVYLPAYAPEFDPVELLWTYIKRNILVDFVAQDLWHLKRQWSVRFDRVRGNGLASAFFQHVSD